ncbi:MAG: phosphopyruvate hydratase [Eubacterium sp.]|nr:phosphopyruvate hydratase [Eubacterium sp.]
MYKYLKIVNIKGREVMDSRGNPTVEAEVTVKVDGKAGELFTGNAIVPSGASTGQFEAVELRDEDDRYVGKGVQQAVKNIDETIFPALEGVNALNQEKVDHIMIELDKTDNKAKLGANAILAVSMANMKACAKALKLPDYKYIGGICGNKMPVPMMNILNGGAHASNNIDVQEFMILPVGACCFKEGLRWCAEVYDSLKKILKKNSLSIAVGDEGGFAPDLSGEEEALDMIVEAIDQAGYKPGEDFKISLDVAASEWKGEKTGEYLMPKKNKKYSTDELIKMWENIVDRYPIFSIEDPLDEEDWEGWSKITSAIGSRVRLVGDDLFVTNVKRLERGIKENSANAILIKPNQIGSVTETIKAVQMAQNKGFIAIMSHRSGESEDTTIADLAVALNTGYIKTGAPCRGERTAKYNQLLRIEELL